MRRKALLLWGTVVIAVVVAVAVIGVVAAHRVTKPAADASAAAPIASADVSDAGPGSLVSATAMPAYSQTRDGRGMQSARVVYRSTSGDTGAATVVSGTVFTPLGAAPAGGWPVVSYGHGTLGIDERCGPSLSENLLGLSSAVSGFIKSGYAVAMADYQGLGSPGVHPYGDARTAGLNMIDAVRALRHTFQGVSNRWTAFGGSQGGGATWAADEQAATYAPDLRLLGAVALSPAADLTGLVDKAQARTLTSDQLLVMQLILASMNRLHPDLNLDEYRHGAATRYWNVLSACAGSDVHNRTTAADALGAEDFSPSTPAAADRLRALLARWALPQQKPSAPLFVQYGAKDTYIDPAWITAAINRACRLGGMVAWNEDPDAGHDVDWAAGLTWLDDRFAERPVANGCA